jgi:Tfp pilus assembly protein PilN
LRPISINLARRPFYNRTLYLAAYAISAGVLLAMTALNGFTLIAERVALARLGRAQATLRQGLEDLDRGEARVRRALQGVQVARLEDDSHFYRQALTQRTFSWTRLFNRLEEVTPPDVKLRSIRPLIDHDHVSIRVAGIAKTPEAFTDFEERLIRSRVFSDVYPSSEDWQGDKRGLLFELGFRYLPAREEAPPPVPPAEPQPGTVAGGAAPDAARGRPA